MSAVALPTRTAVESDLGARWLEYERRKKAWIDEQIAAGVAATSFEYDQAIKRIARECGV